MLVEAGDLIPSDGDVIEGVASVNEAAITGKSAPVIRESGGDRSAVTGGTQVLSDWIKVRITAAPGSTFLDRMLFWRRSRSRAPTVCPARTSAVMRCMAVVDLPDPPFSLPITISRAMRDLDNQMARPLGSAPPDLDDRADSGSGILASALEQALRDRHDVPVGPGVLQAGVEDLDHRRAAGVVAERREVGGSAGSSASTSTAWAAAPSVPVTSRQ